MSSPGRLQQVVAHFRTQLQHHEQQAERALNSAYQHTLASIQPRLDALYREIKAKQDAGETIPPSWLHEQNRLQSIKQLIAQQMSHFGNTTHNTVIQLQHIGATLGTQAGHEQLMATVPPGVHYRFGVPKPEAISDLVGALQPDSPLYKMFHSFGEDAAQNAGNALVRGLTLGDNPRVVSRDVQQALDISRSRALVTARNEMLRCYKSASLETYRSNSDVVGQWRWQSAKSPRSCSMCIAMDGTLHDLTEDFESHVMCRCAAVPVTKSWDEILGGLGIDTSDLSDSAQEYQSGPDWFDEQSESIQKQILGAAKFAAYQDGELSLDDLVGVSHSEAWGTSRYEKSLKAVLGSNANQYYSGN